MKPKVNNKLITLLLLLSLFALVKEMEVRMECMFKKDFAEWASFDYSAVLKKEKTINPYSTELNITKVILEDITSKEILINN